MSRTLITCAPTGIVETNISTELSSIMNTMTQSTMLYHCRVPRLSSKTSPRLCLNRRNCSFMPFSVKRAGEIHDCAYQQNQYCNERLAAAIEQPAQCHNVQKCLYYISHSILFSFFPASENGSENHCANLTLKSGARGGNAGGAGKLLLCRRYAYSAFQ